MADCLSEDKSESRRSPKAYGTASPSAVVKGENGNRNSSGGAGSAKYPPAPRVPAQSQQCLRVRIVARTLHRRRRLDERRIFQNRLRSAPRKMTAATRIRYYP